MNYNYLCCSIPPKKLTIAPTIKHKTPPMIRPEIPTPIPAPIRAKLVTIIAPERYL
jgi:hypothetical protein